MNWSIPRAPGGVQPRSVRMPEPGDHGIEVWALQKALDALRGVACTADGVYGYQDGAAYVEGATGAAVRKAQGLLGIKVDGQPGQQTQEAIARSLIAVVEAKAGLPTRLMEGFAEMEGGWLLAAVNSLTAASGPNPGVDCGLLQRRVYAADYFSDRVIQRAFNTHYQLGLLRDDLLKYQHLYAGGQGTEDRYGSVPPNEKAWRLAALVHNYPVGANRLASTPIRQLSSAWTSPAKWVTDLDYRFPDGTLVRTPLQWCHLYAGVLGAGVYGHSGNVTKHVTHWP